MIEAVEIKHCEQNSRFTAPFLLVVLFVESYILNSSQVYNLNNDGDNPDMNFSLTYNSVNE